MDDGDEFDEFDDDDDDDGDDNNDAVTDQLLKTWNIEKPPNIKRKLTWGTLCCCVEWKALQKTFHC